MRKMTSALLLASSLSLTAGLAMANSMNDDTDISHFTQSTAQNGQNTRVTQTTTTTTTYRDVDTYSKDN